MTPDGRLVSVNAGELRSIELDGRTVPTGIHKQPVAGRVAVVAVGLVGDHQADRRVHGGADQALYAYAAEDYAWWSAELGRELGPGDFGENLTVSGIDVSRSLLGERWRVGSALLEVSELRQPCSKLAGKMEDPTIVRRFARAHRPGAYLRVIEPGVIGLGDAVEVVVRPDHEASMELMSRIAAGERDLVPKLLEADALSERRRQWALARAKPPAELGGEG